MAYLIKMGVFEGAFETFPYKLWRFSPTYFVNCNWKTAFFLLLSRRQHDTRFITRIGGMYSGGGNSFCPTANGATAADGSTADSG